MREFLIAAVSATALAIGGSAALADHKAGHTQNNPDAPGQDRACLVTTSGGASGRVISGKWLPRKAARAQANNQTTFVGTAPVAQTKQGCESLG